MYTAKCHHCRICIADFKHGGLPPICEESQKDLSCIGLKSFRKSFIFLLFGTSQTEFLLNVICSNHTDSDAMDSGVVPYFANSILTYPKTKRLNAYQLKKSKFYLRYVDNISVAYKIDRKSVNFLNFLDNKYPHHFFPFLDVFISAI